MQYQIEESKEGVSLKAVKEDFVKKNSSVKQMVATETELFVLYNNNSFEILSADDISTVVA